MDSVLTLALSFVDSGTSWLLKIIGAALAAFVYAHLKNEQLRAALADLAKGAGQGVLAVEQSFTGELRAQGKLSKGAAAAAFDKAADVARSYVGPKGIKIILDALGEAGLAKQLSAHVEAGVAQLPAKTIAVPLPIAAPAAAGLIPSTGVSQAVATPAPGSVDAPPPPAPVVALVAPAAGGGA